MKRCKCPPCWFGVLYVCGIMPVPVPPPGVPIQPIQAHVTMRSQQPAGTVIHVNLDQHTTGGCNWRFITSASGSFSPVYQQLTGTIDVNVGYDTGGEWNYLGPIVVGGQPTLHVFINAFNASENPIDPQYCSIPEFGLPVASYLPLNSSLHPYLTPFGSGWLTENPGPIKWRDVVDYANAIAGTSYKTDDDARHGTGSANGDGSGLYLAYFDGSVSQPGGIYTVDTIDWFAAHVAANSACWRDLAGPGGEGDDGATAGKLTRRVYQKVIFTCPGTVPTDTIGFDLPITYQQFFSGLTVDGTHFHSDAQENDTDAVPLAELDQALSDEFILWNSLTRTSNGHYRFNGLQFVCRAPSTRRINLWADHNFSGGLQVFRNSPWKQQSADIAVTIGPADCVDVLPTSVSAPHYGQAPVKAGSPILNLGAALRTRILDICGESADFNVVPTATDSVTAALGSSGTNDYGTPTLHGTNPKAATAGFADFTDLYILGLGRHYKLTFTASGLFVGFNGNVIDDISIATDLVFETIPTLHAGVDADIKVDLQDILGGMLIPTTADALTLSGAGSFTGFGAVTPVAGVATFHGNFPAAGTYVIQVVTAGTRYDGPGTHSSLPAVSISVTVLP